MLPGRLLTSWMEFVRGCHQRDLRAPGRRGQGGEGETKPTAGWMVGYINGDCYFINGLSGYNRLHVI